MNRTAVSFLCAALCAPAFAGLGGTVASVDADRASLKGEVRITSQAGFMVHEISSPSGMLVHEYFAPNGMIFAVSWRGPGVPDLKQMLGSYYEQARQAASGPHYNHHHLMVATPEVVVQSSGHLRSFAGRAWAPALLPQNFSINDIK
jgi:uncharacterized protein DUF2844